MLKRGCWHTTSDVEAFFPCVHAHNVTKGACSLSQWSGPTNFSEVLTAFTNRTPRRVSITCLDRWRDAAGVMASTGWTH